MPTLTGTAGNDSIAGGLREDLLLGLDGDDTLAGGGDNADTLSGGAGADLFLIFSTQIDIVESDINVITDWSAADHIRMGGEPLTAAPYFETTAATFAAARSAASARLQDGSANFVVVQVGADLYAFSDRSNENKAASVAVKIAGRNLNDISGENFVFTLRPVEPPLPMPTEGADTLTGSASRETQLGLGGDDLFISSSGDDRLDGGVGFDTVSYGNAPGAIRHSLILSALTDLYIFVPGGYGSDTLVNVERVIATPFDDVLVTSATTNLTLEGGAGNDTIAAPRAVATLDGGPGDDSLSGVDLNFAVRSQTLSGGDGDDTINGGDGSDVLRGGAGSDRFVFSEGFSAPLDVVEDFSLGDLLIFDRGLRLQGGLYSESTAPDLSTAQAQAAAMIAAGTADAVAVAVGADVAVYADGTNINALTHGIVLKGRGLADIDTRAFDIAPPTTPALPRAPNDGAQAFGSVSGNMDSLSLSGFVGGTLTLFGGSRVEVTNPSHNLTLLGTGFGLNSAQQTLTGQVTSVSLSIPGASLSFGSPGFDASPFAGWLEQNAIAEALNSLLSGPNGLRGLSGADLIRGYAGNDLLAGRGGSDQIFGGEGDDVISAGSEPGITTLMTAGQTFLRGEEGNDYILGYDGFDDIHGNMGDDTAGGGPGDDWVVGGKDNDLLFGDAGADLVLGNLGADTVIGGAGDDVLRGGQGSDILFGGDGADFLSGDRGDDTLIGNAGADTINAFSEAGIDRVFDFNAADGDRVRLEPGSTFTARQQGADTIIEVGSAQVILANVTLASLPADWIFVA